MLSFAGLGKAGQKEKILGKPPISGLMESVSGGDGGQGVRPHQSPGSQDNTFPNSSVTVIPAKITDLVGLSEQSSIKIPIEHIIMKRYNRDLATNKNLLLVIGG